ncbi:hypothetical protein [Parasitella parasitica]|uniref:Uncharacterized protein n=1 Tax=Parasitella parasitica TaxID=35722 RepID=A0A0B7NJT8_9FUNG|nr:hypothetical protein [Parasitella parasitica]
MVCDIFYSGTKITIYAWLIEKVYVVSSIRETRWKSKAYRFHLCLMLPYIAIFTLMLIFHVAEIDSSGICIIGLQSIASLPLLIYDFLINFYMTIFFVRPLLKLGAGVKSGWRASRLNEVALRTMVASVVCLIASFANVLALVLFNGRQRGLVCLTCCTVDVTINVVTIHWVTSQAPGKRIKETGVDYSTHHRDSNHENSVYRRHNVNEDQDRTLHHNHSDIVDIIATQQTNAMAAGTVNLYGFTNSDFQIEDLKTVPPYSASPNVTNNDKSSFNRKDTVCEDQSSTDSHFCASSIHESQSSRKSLTKR